MLQFIEKVGRIYHRMLMYSFCKVLIKKEKMLKDELQGDKRDRLIVILIESPRILLY